MYKFQENISILASLSCALDAQVNIFLKKNYKLLIAKFDNKDIHFPLKDIFFQPLEFSNSVANIESFYGSQECY
jgi:hypothetical protein